MKKLGIRLTGILLCLVLLACPVSAARLLIPVGQVVGLELGDGTVTVAAFDDVLGAAAKEAGLQVGDRILRVEGEPVAQPEEVGQLLARSDGTVELEILRGRRQRTLTMTPVITRQGPKLGVFLRRGVTGIGTVTWYDPDTGEFATLGHGVSDSRGGLVQLQQGWAYEARVESVKKGKSGVPGQLRGQTVSAEPLGDLTRNCVQGVFGVTGAGWKGQELPAAEYGQIHTGPARIYSTVRGSRTEEFQVEILKIYPQNRQDGRNFLLKVTDPVLLDAAGGIVQGMSGSPILQDGRLVGAVTHVLVNDPTRGYGIFIENMLAASGR